MQQIPAVVMRMPSQTLPRDARDLLDHLTDEQAAQLLYDWRLWARPDQLPPQGDWRTWLILAGRGAGKTRSGAEFVRGEVEAGRGRRIALVAPTAADARDVMVEGPSGLLAVCPPWRRPAYEPSKRRLTWPGGAIATLYSADEPERLRGPEHDLAWLDELGAWRRQDEAYDMLRMGLRVGGARAVITTTPRPTRLMRELVSDTRVIVTRASTYDNIANLSADAVNALRARYEGTRLGRQELHAELLEDTPGALWTRDMLDAAHQPIPESGRIVIGIDPAVTSGEDSDETGIIVAASLPDGRFAVLEDLSGRFSPHAWASKAVTAYHRLKADRVVAEVNNGGDMVEATIRSVDPDVAFTAVRASRRKRVRAEPIAALYEQNRVLHAASLDVLEDQLCSWAPDSPSSPDRLDALVWALTALSGVDSAPRIHVL